MLALAGIRAIRLVLLLPALGFTQQVPVNSSASAPSQETLFVNCQENEKPKQVLNLSGFRKTKSGAPTLR